MQNIIHQDTIRNNIKRLLNSRKWTAADLEKKTGNTRSINNIIRGTSKYPTIEILTRVAKAFNVEISQLLWEQAEDYQPINYETLKEAFTKVITYLKPLSQEYKLTSENIFTIVNEVYNYSKQLNFSKIDDKFIEWVVSKYYEIS